MSTPQTLWMILAAGVMLTWLVLAVRGPRAIDAAGALAVLRYGPAVRAMALAFALVPPLIMIYAVWAFPWRTEAALNLAGISFLGVSVVGGLLLIEATRVQIVVTEEGLTRYSPWLGESTLNWGDVESVQYSAINFWFIVAGGGKVIRVSRYLAGIDAFADAVHRKVVPDRRAGAAAALDAVK